MCTFNPKACWLEKETNVQPNIKAGLSMEYLRVGFLWGFVFATIHAGWALIVAQNYGQPLIDFLLKIHFLSNPFVVQVFDMTLAYALVGISGVLGLIAGTAFSMLWDLIGDSEPRESREHND